LHLGLTSWRPKIFCLSFQKTGTSSVGIFFEENGYRVVGHQEAVKNDWNRKWFDGDLDGIFKSLDFRSSQVYQDDPWWFLDLYKILFHKYPNSKFILFERDADDWYNSMVKHWDGIVPSNGLVHSKVYHREEDLYAVLDSKGVNPNANKEHNILFRTEKEREHYKKQYELRNREIKDFFAHNAPNRIFICNLYDDEKWVKLGKFFGIKVSKTYNPHKIPNRTKEKAEELLKKAQQ
jgi:hypothetical protein